MAPQGFNILRIAAAAVVVFSHSYLVRTGAEPHPIKFEDHYFTYGRLGVMAFFAISGYLICGSWLSDPDLGRFAKKRFRRIYPALFVMVMLVGVAVGPLVSVSANYFAEPRAYTFVVRNLLVLPFQESLPGVFTNNPVHAVNGVLWTLGLEILAYAVIATLGVTGLLRRGWVLPALAGCLWIVGWPWFLEALPTVASQRLLRDWGCWRASAAQRPCASTASPSRRLTWLRRWRWLPSCPPQACPSRSS